MNHDSFLNLNGAQESGAQVIDGLLLEGFSAVASGRLNRQCAVEQGWPAIYDLLENCKKTGLPLAKKTMQTEPFWRLSLSFPALFKEDGSELSLDELLAGQLPPVPSSLQVLWVDRDGQLLSPEQLPPRPEQLGLAPALCGSAGAQEMSWGVPQAPPASL